MTDEVEVKEELEEATTEIVEVEEKKEEEDKTEDGESEASDDEEILKKQEAYRSFREREKQRAQKEAEAVAAALAAKKEPPKDNKEDDLAEVKAFIQHQKLERQIVQAEAELIALEKPFKEAFTDYDDVVKNALEFTKIRLTEQGYTPEQADAYLRREKVLLADAAAARGDDPVEAVYNEAKSIMNTVDKFAAQLGYSKGKPKTNLQAAKELAKPNAFSGGAGRGAKNEFRKEDMGDDDLQSLKTFTLADWGM